MSAARAPVELYGLLAEFADSEALLNAARAAYAAGYRKMNAYTPFPLEGLSETLGQKRSRLPALVFLGGALGGGQTNDGAHFADPARAAAGRGAGLMACSPRPPLHGPGP